MVLIKTASHFQYELYDFGTIHPDGTYLSSKNNMHGRPETIRLGACCTGSIKRRASVAASVPATGAVTMAMTTRGDDDL